jgi:hypothetical protein
LLLDAADPEVDFSQPENKKYISTISKNNSWGFFMEFIIEWNRMCL